MDTTSNTALGDAIRRIPEIEQLWAGYESPCYAVAVLAGIIAATCDWPELRPRELAVDLTETHTFRSTPSDSFIRYLVSSAGCTDFAVTREGSGGFYLAPADQPDRELAFETEHSPADYSLKDYELANGLHRTLVSCWSKNPGAIEFLAEQHLDILHSDQIRTWMPRPDDPLPFDENSSRPLTMFSAITYIPKEIVLDFLRGLLPLSRNLSTYEMYAYDICDQTGAETLLLQPAENLIQAAKRVRLPLSTFLLVLASCGEAGYSASGSKAFLNSLRRICRLLNCSISILYREQEGELDKEADCGLRVAVTVPFSPGDSPASVHPDVLISEWKPDDRMTGCRGWFGKWYNEQGAAVG